MAYEGYWIHIYFQRIWLLLIIEFILGLVGVEIRSQELKFQWTASRYPVPVVPNEIFVRVLQ